MTAWAMEALLASAVLVALVLALRVPVRRAFGPTAAYALWALPVLRLLLPPIALGWTPAGPAPVTLASERVAVMLMVQDAAPVAAAAPAAAPLLPVGPLLATIWAVGALLVIGRYAIGYRRFRRRAVAAATRVGTVGRIALIVSDAVSDPLAFGVLRPVVAVPRDFRARYDARERELALAHEVAHHRRGDIAANWIALVVLALQWPNPLAWVALAAFRADQEMAADATVLARRDAGDAYAYGCALAKAAGLSVPAATCGLHTVNDLKGRLRMLAKPTSPGRCAAGLAAVATASLALLGLTASGGSAAETVRAGVERATGVPLASLAAAAPVQVEAPEPPAPPAVAPPPTRHHTVHVERRDGRATSVTVTRDGRTERYEGAAAEAWLAAHPVPAPPAPPVPPAPGAASVPPAPPAPPVPPAPLAQRGVNRVIVRDRFGEIRSRDFGALARVGDVPRVQSLYCPAGTGDGRMVLEDGSGGLRRVVICTNRVAAAPRDAAQAAAVASGQAAAARRAGLVSALDELRATRASMASHRDMAEWERSEALETIDGSIRRVGAQLGGGA